MMALERFFEGMASPLNAFIALLVLIASTVIIGALSPEDKIAPNINVPYVAIGRTFGYESEPLYKMLDALNAQPDGKNRTLYRNFLYYDLIYPWFYGLAGAILLAFLQKNFNEQAAIKAHYFWTLPLLAALFDFGENISMLILLRLYDGKPRNALLGFSQLMTMLKIIFICASFLMVVFATLMLIGAGIKALKKRAMTKAAAENKKAQPANP